MSSTPVPPRARPSLPPEVLTHVLQLAVADLPPYERSHQLAQFALVSHQLQPSAYEVLYRDLRVPWQAEHARRLLRTLEANPALGQLTRRFETFPVSRFEWLDQWTIRMKRLMDDGAAAPWDRPDADGLVGPPSREADDADGEWDDEEWEYAFFRAAIQAWKRAGHARWLSLADGGSGSNAVDDLIATLPPTLRTLALGPPHPLRV